MPVFQQLCLQHLPEVDVFNIVDDSLIKQVIARGELQPDTARRVVNYAGAAESAGADFIMFTCSSIGAAVETAAGLTKVPVLRVDQPMADKAVAIGKRVGVIATLPTTLSPTSDLVKRRAAFAGKEIEITSVLCEGAFETLMRGNATLHDEMVTNALKELTTETDVIVLAQASMARVVDRLQPSEKIVPILASPPIAMAYLASLL
ncbi:MAG: aspartate/glutamate racemase family protein [Spirosomataceae bacterium]